MPYFICKRPHLIFFLSIFSDALVAAALGTKSFGFVKYNTVMQNITGLLTAGVQGVNHSTLYQHRLARRPLTGSDHLDIAQDGHTVVLTVTIQ